MRAILVSVGGTISDEIGGFSAGDVENQALRLR